MSSRKIKILRQGLFNMFNIKLQSEYEDLDKYENKDGVIFYCKKDTRMQHNPYGPAVVSKDGYKAYFINNQWHRLDGPALILLDGRKIYFINDKELTKEEFETHPERLKFLGKEHLICLG